MWGRLAALAALCGRLRVLPCRGGLGVPLALLRALFGAGTLLRPLPLWGGCFRLPVRFLVQHIFALCLRGLTARGGEAPSPARAGLLLQRYD